jgi:FHA domain.
MDDTIVLPDMSLYSESLSDNSFYLFAVYDGRIERFRLADKMRLGRMTKDNVPEIAIQNMFLSRSHGYFSIENGSVSYTAEETTNGIYLNGTVIPAGETVVLSDGDELVIPTDRTSGNKNSIMQIGRASCRERA